MTQVTSLSLSKELWENGLRIETEKWWVQFTLDNAPTLKTSQWLENYDNKEGLLQGYNKIAQAYQTDELLAVMPKTISKDGNSAYLEIRMHNNASDVCYYHPHYFVSQTDKILSEALGKMCLWLLSNGYKYEEKEKWMVKK